MIDVSWTHKWFKPGFEVSNAGVSRGYFFSNERLDRVPRTLRGPQPEQALKDFQQLFDETEFVSWWDQTCGGKEDKLVNLRFPRDHSFLPFSSGWEIPWELLIERLRATEVQSTVSIARSLRGNLASSPSSFDEPLKILILQGDDGASIKRKLNLDREADYILGAWRSLALGIQQCIREPIVEVVDRVNLSKLLTDHTPHVIWFSGHGRARPKAGLLLAKNDWVTASDFAKLIAKAYQSLSNEHPPLYAIFWACDTGRPDDKQDTVAVSPSLFDELSKVGVLGMLAMQSPIRDANAVSMATGLLEHLASGLPLERAVARVRARLMDRPAIRGAELDWAAPVVWSAGEFAERLSWNSQAQPLAQLQLLGQQMLRWRRKSPSELDGPPTEDELHKARTWVSSPRMWVAGRWEDDENRLRWVRALRAIQVETNRFVIAIDLRSGDASEALQEWAEDIRRWIRPGDFPDEVALVLNQIIKNPTPGWRKLCALQNTYLAIAMPPEYPSPEWFWEPLVSSSDDFRVAIFSNQEISKDVPDEWSVDAIRSEMDEPSIETAVRKAPRLARALALLNMPLSPYLISVQAEQDEGARSLNEWAEGFNLTVETDAGTIITSTARQYILSDQDPDILEKAHRDCVGILAQPQVYFSTQIGEKLLEHLLGGGLNSKALQQASELCFLYRNQDRPSAVLQLLGRIGPLWTDLPDTALLVATWAYVQLGKPRYAKIFLRHAEPVSALEKAWKHGLQAEIYKSEGTEYSKESALEEIGAAIEECRRAEPDAQTSADLIKRRLRAYRQDRARILQFLFYKKEEAAREYAQLLNEWGGQPDAAVDLAVVKRNYAECLRSIGGDSNRRMARDLIKEAAQLVEDRPYLPVYCEILYEEANAQEADGNLQGARETLLACQKAALQSQHYMVWAIAENRLFWRCMPLDLRRWEEVAASLENFPSHGWAVRTLVDGRLRAARRLEDLGNSIEAYKQLTAAKSGLDRNPSFNVGSDRFRIAATMAGLEVIGKRLGSKDSYWAHFIETYRWSSEWFQEKGFANDPETIWLEVK